jgi:tRNA1Val (adenine37-N6)-methyltransferase
MMKKADTRPFHFKQFSLYHHRSTMKVGTDAVILGVWTDVEAVSEALDIGTGSGILSLLLAARSQCRIEAVEIDLASVEEARDNFSNSPFAHRLIVHQADFNSFAKQNEKRYDLIISNPPFFINDRKSEKEHKRLARHTDTLTYEQLIDGALHLLKPDGHISVVLPYREGQQFIQLAIRKGLFVQRQMLIFPRPCQSPNRMNLQLGFDKLSVEQEKFIIRNEDGSFTQAYLSLLSDFYTSI